MIKDAKCALIIITAPITGCPEVFYSFYTTATVTICNLLMDRSYFFCPLYFIAKAVKHPLDTIII